MIRFVNTSGAKTFFRQLLALSGFHNVGSILNDKLILVGSLLTKHCEFITAQRLRRACQTCALYSRIYSEASFKRMVHSFKSTYGDKLNNAGGRPLGMLLGAAFFCWEKEKISLEEMQSCIEELESSKVSLQTPPKNLQNNPVEISNWVLIIDKENLKVWQKPMPHTSIYEYKVYGSFYDIPASNFFRVQVDIEYRKKWDKLVINLDVIDRDQKTNCEVVHWVMHYPFPMYSRDYVYIRRYHIDPLHKAMVLVSKSTDHPYCPVNNRYVRVSEYRSTMVIKPHSEINENGFDFVLTYFDDPQAMIPNPAYRWMASSGVPDFVEKLHQAALALGQHENDSNSNKNAQNYQRTNQVVSNSSQMYAVN